jgi:hypothetical protein
MKEKRSMALIPDLELSQVRALNPIITRVTTQYYPLSTIRAVAFHTPLKISERLEKIMKQLSPLIQLDSSDHVLFPEIEALQQAVLGGRVATVFLKVDGGPDFCDCSQ